jgi:hypothetical protein
VTEAPQHTHVVLEVAARHWWQHFKGGTYMVQRVSIHHGPEAQAHPPELRFNVHYRLWGRNEVHERPLWEWLDWVARDAYTGWRFWPHAEWEKPFPDELRPPKAAGA